MKHNIKRVLRADLTIPAGVDRRFSETLAAFGAEPSMVTPAPQPARRRPVYRVILIAAAAMMLLTVTALAVSPELRRMVGWPSVKSIPEDDFASDDYKSKIIESEIYAHPISDKLQAYMDTHEGTPQTGVFSGSLPDDVWEKTPEELWAEGYVIYNYKNIAFSSMTEAADFYDIRLSKNTLLTSFEPIDASFPFLKSSFSTNAEGRSALADISAYYDLGNGNTVHYYARFICDDRMTGPASFGHADIGYYTGESAFETYTGAPSGVAALIWAPGGYFGEFSRYFAFFVMDDIAYNLEVTNFQNPDDTVKTLKDIIDAFE